MPEIILETAQCDERIWAVIMNGSRVNPIALSKPFQDMGSSNCSPQSKKFISEKC